MTIGAQREQIFLLEPLADLGQELHGAVGTSLHRTQPALHEAHHLEEEEVDDGPCGQEHRSQHADRPENRLLPVRQHDGSAHRSMSPRMKYRLARMEITSGT